MKLITISPNGTELILNSDTLTKIPRNFFENYETVQHVQLFLTNITYFSRNNFVFFNNITKLYIEAKFIQNCNTMIFTNLKHLLYLNFNVPSLEQLPFLNENKRLQNVQLYIDSIKNVYESLFKNQHMVNYLRLSICIKKLPSRLFSSSLKQLHTLIIENNGLFLTHLKINRNHLHYLKSLYVLKLHRVILCNYESDYFEIIPTLHTLSLTDCTITNYCNFFENLPNLQKLILNCNSFYAFLYTFESNPQLKYINLNDNILISLTKNCLKNCINITHINLSHCNLHNLEIGSLSSCKSLRFLNLSHNFINTINYSLLMNCNYLLRLNFSSNLLGDLITKIFQNIHNLVDISFENNLISKLIDGIFCNLIHLKRLNLFKNNFQSFKKKWFNFNYIYAIETLNMGRNLLTKIPQINTSIFPQLIPNLKQLNFKCNNIRLLYTNNFINLNNLIELDLSQNAIINIETQAFHSLTQLTILKLHKNNIILIQTGIFDDLHSLEFIDLSDNRITQLDPYLFRFNRFLNWVSFKSNYIIEIPNQLFINNWQLNYVNVFNNPITSIDLQTFQYSSKLKFIIHNELVFNPFFQK